MQESCTQGAELARGGEGESYGRWERCTQGAELARPGGGGVYGRRESCTQGAEPSKPFDIRQGATGFGVCPDFFCLA